MQNPKIGYNDGRDETNVPAMRPLMDSQSPKPEELPALQTAEVEHAESLSERTRTRPRPQGENEAARWPVTIAEIAAHVVETKTAHLLRYRSNSVKETGTAQYDCKPMFTGSKRGWTMLDIQTAGAIYACYQSLSRTQPPERLAKFNNIGIDKLVDFCWRHVR